MANIEHKSFVIESKADGQEGTFVGYAAVWGNPDSYGDVMVRGAFADSIASRGLPLLSWEHEWGLGPIGELTAALEDDTGLRVEGRLYTEDPLVARIYRSMRAGGITEMSFAFITKDAEPGVQDGEDVRLVKAVDWLEAALVVKGANDRAQLVSVRSVTEESLGLGPDADAALEARIKEVIDRYAEQSAADQAAQAGAAERQEYLEALAVVQMTEPT